jgi:Nineteen complex-related protein 2
MGPVYDEAYLNVLRANTPLRPRFAAHDNGALLDSAPADMALDDFGSNGVNPLLPHSLHVDSFFFSSTDTGEAAIPSQSFVPAATERRERLRATGSTSPHADKYIYGISTLVSMQKLYEAIDILRVPPSAPLGQRTSASLPRRGRLLCRRRTSHLLILPIISPPPRNCLGNVMKPYRVRRSTSPRILLGIGLRFAGWRERFAIA